MLVKGYLLRASGGEGRKLLTRADAISIKTLVRLFPSSHPCPNDILRCDIRLGPSLTALNNATWICEIRAIPCNARDAPFSDP